MSFSHDFQYLQVEIDAQGNLVQIVNLNKSITVPFTSQGFYWYEGIVYTEYQKVCVFIPFEFEAFLMVFLSKIIKHQVLILFDHIIKLHNQ